MYGTIMRARVRASRRDEYVRMMTESAPEQATGFIGAQVGWEDGDPDRLVLVIVFRDREAYTRNADDPRTDAMYRKQLEYFEGEPEWIDVNWAQYIGGPSGQAGA